MLPTVARVLALVSLLAAAFVVVHGGVGGTPAAHAADEVLIPPTLDYTPDLSAGPAGQSCALASVRCVGASGEHPSIQQAVDAATDGDTVQVQAGTYREQVVVSGKELTLLGGFPAGFADRDAAAQVTTIDADGAGTALTLSDAGDTVVDGFRITGGRAALDEFDRAEGSGVRIEISGAVTLSHNLIEGNDDAQDFTTCSCRTSGGGLHASSYLVGASLTLSANVFRDNGSHAGAALFSSVPTTMTANLVVDNVGRGDHGGGVYLTGDGSVLRQNLIRDNEIGAETGYGWGGGAIFVGAGTSERPEISIEANRWTGNSAPLIGSALFVDEAAQATIVGDLFHDNACGNRGAGFYIDGGGGVGSRASLENVTITGHACDPGADGTGVFAEGGSRVDITGSIITGNGGDSDVEQCDACQAGAPATPASTITHSLVGATAGSVTEGAGILDEDPQFVAPGAGDLHLAPDSPGIDAAGPAAVVGEEPAPNGGRRNAGAYGGTAEATVSPGGSDPTPGLPPPGPDVWGGTCDAPATGTVYDVGPGRPLTSIGAVPWQSLGPGDRVRIHARPTPYREKILISEQGTATEPITVCGVPDEDGDRPVLDGDGATTRPGMQSDFARTQDRGLVTFSAKEGDGWGTKPEYVVLDGFELTGAFGGNTFTDFAGQTATYPDNAAGIFVERGEHITLRDNVIRGNANGLFVASGDSEEAVSRDLLVEANEFRDNSMPGRDREHHSYVEALDVVYQLNHYGATATDSLGGALKDRSSGTVVRFNWIEGGARALDLVEAQETWPLVRDTPAELAKYRQTYVYGNAIDLGPGDSTTVVHYGGDSGGEDTYRKGTLHFFHNTVSIARDQSEAWRSSIFDVSTLDETVRAWGNAVHLTSATPGATPTNLALGRVSGTILLGPNVISPAITDDPDNAEFVAYDAEITGSGDQVRPASGDWFIDRVGDDLRPADGSPLIDLGAAPPAGTTMPARHTLASQPYQYVPHRLALGRPVNGASVDAGAWEHGPATGIGDPVSEPTAACVAARRQLTEAGTALTRAKARKSRAAAKVRTLTKKLTKAKKAKPAVKPAMKKRLRTRLAAAKRAKRSAEVRVMAARASVAAGEVAVAEEC